MTQRPLIPAEEINDVAQKLTFENQRDYKGIAEKYLYSAISKLLKGMVPLEGTTRIHAYGNMKFSWRERDIVDRAARRIVQDYLNSLVTKKV